MFYRGRRLRTSQTIRTMVQETRLSVKNLIYPLFLVEGNNIKKEIPSLKGQYHISIDRLEEEIKEILSLKIPAILLFGLPGYKDDLASNAYDDNGIVQKGIRKIKEIAPDLLVVTDVCLCQYTSHGHCGVLKDGKVLNDPTLELLAKTALSHVKAGADMVAPSDMMDGRVNAIRDILDDEGFEYTPIMSYSVKYASSFYGPFREVADSAPKSGDRKSYQMNPANTNEALMEAEADLMEGADILMVKPALAYQDIIYRLKENFDCPIAAYNVSGEYAMVKAAASQGLIDEKSVVMEMLTGIKRAGADLIITYFAKDAAKYLREE
ncbi:MAG: delta-aminolevulinic acid dehydratase [Candidatus Melainabacteria bacterium GWF2_37_15]|nr:MAG: delta-aminolevulinic acid dehydratase [Candidatus Melainabacteria bacterium GWF2_37_15]